MSISRLLIPFLVCCFLPLSIGESNSAYLPGIQGRVVANGLTRYRDVHLLLLLNGGDEQRQIFCRSDGTFTLPKLPAGVHILTVLSMDYTFPYIKVDVSSREDGNVRLSYLENRKPISTPIELRGFFMGRFEKRQPFSLWSLVKSPYGITICLMIVGIVIFPMMKVDPEEYRQMQQMWTNSQQTTQTQSETQALPAKSPLHPSRRKD